MDLERLRRETVSDHLAVEGSVPLMGEGLSEDNYVFCLRQIHGMVTAWEEWASRNAPDWMQSILATRNRRELLERDLEWFGAGCPDGIRPVLPEMNDDASVLGSMYVMEGSTLGGQLIARHVEHALGLNPGQGDAYFRGHNERTGVMWKEFCDLLRTRVPDSDTDAVIAAAKAMFRAFGTWMKTTAK